MAAFQGKQGKVTFATTAVANVLSWSLDAVCDFATSAVMSPVTVAASTHWKDHVAGFKAFSGTVECDCDNAGFDPDMDTDFIDDNGIAFVLYEGLQADGVRMYSGTAIITSIAPSIDKDDVAKIIYSFQGSGTLSVAASDLV